MTSGLAIRINASIFFVQPAMLSASLLRFTIHFTWTSIARRIDTRMANSAPRKDKKISSQWHSISQLAKGTNVSSQLFLLWFFLAGRTFSGSGGVCLTAKGADGTTTTFFYSQLVVDQLLWLRQVDHRHWSFSRRTSPQRPRNKDSPHNGEVFAPVFLHKSSPQNFYFSVDTAVRRRRGSHLLLW